MTDSMNSPPPASNDSNMDGSGQEKRRDFSIYCSNMPRNSNEDEIRDMFAKYGDVHAVVIYKPHDQFRGIVFVRMDSPESCQMAIRALNDTQYKGHTMKLSIARDRSRDGRRDWNSGNGNSRRWDNGYNNNPPPYQMPPPPPYPGFNPYAFPPPPYPGYNPYAMPPPSQPVPPPMPGQPQMPAVPQQPPVQPPAQPMYDPRMYNPYAPQPPVQPPAQPSVPPSGSYY